MDSGQRLLTYNSSENTDNNDLIHFESKKMNKQSEQEIEYELAYLSHL